MADLDYLINFNSNTAGIDKSKFAINKLSAAMAALGVGFGASELASIADEYSNIAAFINIAVGETGNFEQAMTGVRDVALATNTNLTATTQLFYKINEAGKQMGLTQQDSLELTETINKAMQLGGGSAASNEAAIIQLTQALQSGLLRGEEFNSIMEQAPGISKALAASLGVTTGELRGMANEGKLSAQTVISALQEQSDTIASEFDKLPITVEKALQNIRTQWTVLLGEFNQDSGATSKVVEWLGVLEDNMSMIDTVLADVGDGMQWVGEQIDGIDTGTIIAMRQALASAYDAIKSFAGAMAEGFEDLVDNLDLTLGMLFDFDSGLSDTESKTSGFTKAIQGLNVALGFISDGFSGITIASKLITGAFYDMAAAWYQLKSTFTFGSVKDEAVADMQAMSAQAQKFYSEASNAALEFKSKGVAAIEDLKKTEEEVNAETLAELKANFEDKTQAYQDFFLYETNYAAQRIELEKKVSEARKNGDSARLTTYSKQLDDLTAKEQESTEKRIDLEESRLAAAQDFAQKAVDLNNGVLNSEVRLELAKQDYIASVDEAGRVSVESFSKVEGAASEANLTLKDMALNAAKGLGIDVPEALNQLSSGFERSKEAVNRVADGYGELRAEGLNASDLLYASLMKLLEGAKSQAEIDNVRQMYIQFGQDGKISTRQVEAGTDAINEKLSKTPELLSETARAFKELGIISQAEADKQAEEAVANYEIVKQSGQANAAQLQEALEGIYTKIKDSGNSTLKTWYDNQSASLGFSNSLKEVEQSANSATSAIKENSDARAEQSTTTWNASFATDAAMQSESASLAVMQQMTATIKGKISALESMGATTEQVDDTWRRLTDSMNGTKFLGIADFANSMQRVDDIVTGQIDSFQQARDRATEMTQALSGNAVTSRDLADAQHALRQATDASIEGLIRMDQSTLDNLQNAIDETKQKMRDLAEEAKATALQLESELATLRGDSDRALEIEQAKDLKEVEDLLADARERGNAEEIKYYSEALKLQKEINKEERKQASASQKQASQPQTSTQSYSSSAPSTNTPTKKILVELKSNSGTVNAEIPEGQEALFQAFVKQLQDSKAIAGY